MRRERRPLTYSLTLAALLGLLLVSCIRLISAEPLENGGAVLCVKVDPPPDAGPDTGVSPVPALRYVPVPTPLPVSPASSPVP